MKNKYKKQRKSITIKITTILLAVWLIISAVFCITVINQEKEKLVNEYHDEFSTLVRNINYNDYYLADTYVNYLKQPYNYTIDVEKPELKCGADGYLDNSMQAVILAENEDGTFSEVLDTDNVVQINGYGTCAIDDKESKSLLSGSLVYDRFIQSITQEQLDSISEYLYTKKDKDGNYYELICKKFYFDEESYQIIPKTVEIVLTDENDTWYAQNKVVKTYELSPLFTDDLPLYTSALDNRNVIPGQFVLGTFQSGNLVDSYTKEEGYLYYDGGYTKISAFSYVYKNSETVFTKTTYSEDTEDEILYGDSDSGTYTYTVTQSKKPNITIKYAKSFNVLDSCKDTLILGIAVLFLFFLVVGVILSIMMCKVMKTQVLAEQKRVEITNALAHDIKTPLFIISGYAQNLKENVNTQKRGLYADKIIEKTDEVNSIVHKMLDFTKLGELDTKPEHDEIDLKALITDIIAEFDTLSNGKHFEINCDDNVMINGDTELLTRALRNLVDNAVRYSDNGSVIKVELTDNTLSVSNDCSSITQDDIPHLTEPYYKAEKNRNTKGNGLGLSIVKSIIDMHNYKLDIKLDNQTITFSILF